MNNNPSEIKAKILELTRQYSHLTHSQYRAGNDLLRKKWVKGNPIPYAGRVFDEDEVEAAVSATLDFWLTLGKEGVCMEKELEKFLGISNSLLVNSGSSANLIAISCLTSNKLDDKKRIKKGDEIITVACGFPTTVAPIIQIGAIPVFIDANPITGNPNCSELENAFNEGKTKAVMMAHALGNPFDLYSVLYFCKKHNLWLIEDNCDALGCAYSMPKSKAADLGIHENSPGLSDGLDKVIRWTGTWGDISTQSFYPPHHITMGEGGAVNIIRDKKLKKIAESFRDWGRDCWCPSGTDNTCGKRFNWKLGELEYGYDHKYTYSHLGYNLKPLDIQAAIGCIQIRKLEYFIQARKHNWNILREKLNDLNQFFEFCLPTHATNWTKEKGFEWDDSGCKSICSWFGFKLTVKDNAPFSRTELAEVLDKNKIGNRMMFGGNLIKQPAFVNLQKEAPGSFRVVSELKGSDSIMMNTLFLGTYPGLTSEMIDFEVDTIKQFVEQKLNENSI